MKSEFNNNDKAKEKTGLTETGVNLVGYGTKGVDGDVSLSPTEKEIPYPKSVFFIITNEFCERFSYYGMKAVLTLYLKTVLDYTEDKATVIYHVFSMLCYFTPIFGAMLADSLLGKFKTILYLSLVYAVGNIVLSLASITPLKLPTEPFSLLGLLLIAIGTGGIKPCVSAFGGDQFVLPQQAAQLASYFSIFYFSINAGSLLSTIITPIFRQDIKCFDALTCYPLAFGVPAVLMIVSLIVFVIGYRWYTIRKPDGNITAKVGSCIAHAIREKSKSNFKAHDHWLDYASNKFDSELIEDVKCLLRVLVLYIPLPVFWALFDQQGSRWTFQATRMDGDFYGYVIKPDQMQVLNPLLILAMIPIFDQGIYPALGKVGLLKKPLQRLTFGGVMAGVAFVISGILEMNLEATYAVKLSQSESHINFINDSPCPLKFQMDKFDDANITSSSQYILKQIEAGTQYIARFTPDGDKCKNFPVLELPFEAVGKEARSYLITSDDKSLTFRKATRPDILKKDGDGAAMAKFMLIGFDQGTYANSTLMFEIDSKAADIWEEPELESEMEGEHRVKAKQVSGVPVSGFDSAFYKLAPVKQQIKLVTPPVESRDVSRKSELIGEINPKQGGNYVYIIKKNPSKDTFEIKEFVITQPNSIHMLWLVPQYVIITIGEVMFSVTGLQFAFSQAPASMKSVLQAAWLLTVAFGNVIVVFIAEFKIFHEQWKEFFLYAGLMFVDMIIFAVLAYFYKPIEIAKDKKDDPPDTVEMKENKMNEGYDP